MPVVACHGFSEALPGRFSYTIALDEALRSTQFYYRFLAAPLIFTVGNDVSCHIVINIGVLNSVFLLIMVILHISYQRCCHSTLHA